jgi:hypothetical protein
VQTDLPRGGDLLGGDLPDDEQQHREDNGAFFHQTLPGRDAPLGSPGGAATVGAIGVDTPLVAAMPTPDR